MISAVRRLVAFAGIVLLTVALTVARTTIAANATDTTVTITGPSSGTYFQLITLTGTTSPPNTTVAVYVSHDGGPMLQRATVVSDGSGNFSYSWRLTSNITYLAIANGVTSARHATLLAVPHCSTSTPLFARPAVPKNAFDLLSPYWTPFAALNAVNDNGLYAGIDWNGYTAIGVISWRPGQAAQLLASFDYRNVSFEPGIDGSVNVVGVTDAGGVVAAVQRTDTNVNFPTMFYVGFEWLNGKRYQLSHAATWNSYQPMAVSDSGQIIGVARKGLSFAVVTWASATSPYTVVANVGDNFPFPSMDGSGDIVWTNDAGLSWQVRPSGSTARPLGGLPSEISIDVTAGDMGGSFYGRSGQSDNLSAPVRWKVAPGSAALTPIQLGPESSNVWINAVGRRGDLVLGSDSPRYLLSVKHAYVKLPPEMRPDGARTAGETVDRYGRVAVTGLDGNVRFFSCG